MDEETGDAQTPQIPAKKIKTQPITPSTPQLMSPEEEDNIVTSLVSESSAVPVNASQTTPATTEGTARRGRKKIVKQNSKTFNLISQVFRFDNVVSFTFSLLIFTSFFLE